MLNWNLNWWQKGLFLLIIAICTIVCFPCWLLQKIGIKSRMYAKALCTIGIDQLSALEVIEYETKKQDKN